MSTNSKVEVIKIPGITFILRVPSINTAGNIVVYEEITDPNIGPAQHYHEIQTEIFKVLEGKYLVQVGNEKFEANKGDFFAVPPKTIHTFLNIHNKPSRLEFSLLPALDSEEFFRKLPEIVKNKNEHHKIGEIAKDFGTTVVGPPLKQNP